MNKVIASQNGLREGILRDLLLAHEKKIKLKKKYKCKQFKMA